MHIRPDPQAPLTATAAHTKRKLNQGKQTLIFQACNIEKCFVSLVRRGEAIVSRSPDIVISASEKPGASTSVFCKCIQNA